jgi:hypothetical protein
MENIKYVPYCRVRYSITLQVVVIVGNGISITQGTGNHFTEQPSGLIL